MKSYIKPLISDSIFIILISIISYYSYTKIQSHMGFIKTLTPDIQNLENTLLENTSKFDFSALNINLEIINQAMNKIIVISAIAIIAIALIYILTQSYSYLKKFNLNYLKKFTIISIPYFIISIYLIFKVLTSTREFILQFWFENQTNLNLLIPTAIYFIILLVFIYFITLTQSYLIKNNIKTALKKALIEFKNYKTMSRLLVITIIIIILMFIAIRYFTLPLKIITIFIILLIINYCRNTLPR